MTSGYTRAVNDLMGEVDRMDDRNQTRRNPFSLGATSEEIIDDLCEQLADANAGYASQMREIAALKDEREKLLSLADAHDAVIVRRRCPSCRVRWSCDECSEMFKAREASCLCGYRQPLGIAVISRATGAA